jgi:ABC-type phosphate transport system substrate-binding protein
MISFTGGKNRFFTNEMVNNRQIKLLKINGVYPDIESIKNQTYLLTSDFYAVMLSDNISPNAVKFLEWILSPQGQAVVEKKVIVQYIRTPPPLFTTITVGVKRIPACQTVS